MLGTKLIPQHHLLHLHTSQLHSPYFENTPRASLFDQATFVQIRDLLRQQKATNLENRTLKQPTISRRLRNTDFLLLTPIHQMPNNMGFGKLEK